MKSVGLEIHLLGGFLWFDGEHGYQYKLTLGY